MIIKRYMVNNMNEAMTRIRYELGNDAVIISQRKIRKPGLKGFFSKKIIEVTAAIENVKKNDEVVSSIEALKNAIKKENTDIQNEAAIEKEIVIEEGIKQDNMKEQVPPVELLKELHDMKSMLNDMMQKSPEKSVRKSRLQTKLENSDLNEKTVKKVITKIKAVDGEATDELEKANQVLEKMVSISKAKMEGKIVFVGPTGVGKTTTIAKLAGRLALVEKKKVGLITIDTYRIGAVEQLRTYADIMNIPFKVVLTIKEMETAINSMSDCDVVLIDTTGRSSKNSMQISELRAFVEKANTDNIHLVLSCTTKNKDIEAIIEGYRVLNYNNVIITKLDETSTYGSILNILESSKKSLSFVTTGQNVPDDIKKLSSSEVSKLILGEDYVC